jgi:hypothetical protein
MLCLVSKPVAEVAKQVRLALKRAFPGQVTGFSVRSSPALLRVRWCGGPVEEDVERVVNAVITEGSPVAAVFARWSIVGVGHLGSVVTGPASKES